MADKIKKGLNVRFWGTRGSVPASGKEFDIYGGDTTCAELPAYNIIIDGGTGLRHLGLRLPGKERLKYPLHIFFSHYHWDHIQGVPFFAPLYMENVEINLYGPGDVKEILAEQMRSPYFPMPYKGLKSTLIHHTIDAEDEINLGNRVSVSFYPTRHPQETLAMRFETPRGVFVFSTDHEHDSVYRKELGRGFQRFAEGADGFYADCQYTDEEYKNKVGWGHSSVSQIIQLANDVCPKKLLLSHHDPTHTDDKVAEIERIVSREFPYTHACRSFEEIIL